MFYSSVKLQCDEMQADLYFSAFILDSSFSTFSFNTQNINAMNIINICKFNQYSMLL